MEKLKKRIAERIKAKKHCIVFQKDLERLFSYESPANEVLKERITKFAEENGWDVIITNPALRATFRKKKSS
jgi:adenine/guanine phosphoribosyltransferase-like PRPP-binding protein